MGAIELDMKMMFGSNLILLLLVNLAFASLSDNVPEEEANRVRRRGPSSGGGGALEKRTQFMEECGGDLACVRGKMREWRRGKKSGRFWPRPFPTRGGDWQGDSTKTFLIWRGFAEENPVHGRVRWRSRLCSRQDERMEEGEEVRRRGRSRPPPVQW